MKLLLNLSSIKKSSKVIRNSLLQSKKATVDSKKIFFRKTKVKSDAIRRKDTFLRNKKEYDRRKAQEAAIEAKNIVTNPIKVVGRSAGGFLSRILSFIGTLLLGWIVNNLPTIIAMAQEFIARARRLYELFTGFISNVLSSVKNFGNVLGAVFQNIITLDFFDTSNRVKNSLDDLQKNFDDMGKQLDEGMRLVTTSLTEPIAPEGPGAIPPTGTDYGVDSTERSEGDTSTGAAGGNGGSRATYGTPRERALLDAIAMAEGTSGPNGYRTMFGGGTFDTSKGWKHPDTVIRGGRYSSAAAGRYQFLPGTWNAAAKALGLKDFSPVNQDKAALYLAKRRGVTDAMLAKEGLSQRISDLLAPEWASFPYSPKGGQSYYGQPVKKLSTIQAEYKKSLGSPVEQKDKLVSSPTSIPSQTALPPLPPTNTLPGKQHYGAARDGGRKHAGVDFDAPPDGTFYSRIGGEVKHIGNDPGGYFKYVDIYNPQLNVTERIAEGDNILVKVGQKVSPGTPVAKGTNSTGVFHYEIRQGSNRTYGFSGTVDPIKFLKSANVSPQKSNTSTPSSSPTKSSTSTSTTSTTTTSTPTQSMVTGKSGYVGSTNVVSTGYKDASGRDIKLNPGAAQAFKQMVADGMPFNSGEIANVYRDENEYLRLKSQGYKPASNSKHNLGMAADIHGAMNTWIRKNGAKYGWYANDYSGSHGGHFEWRGGGSSVSPQTPATPSQPDIASGQQAETSTQRFPVISTTGRALNTVNAIQTPIDDSQQFIYIDDIQQQSPSQPSGGKSSGGMMPIIINNRNKFMKDMLLLDLAYT